MTRLEQALLTYNGTHAEPMTAARLAARVGLHERTVRRHLDGVTRMDEEQIVAYAKALELSPSELLGEKP